MASAGPPPPPSWHQSAKAAARIVLGEGRAEALRLYLRRRRAAHRRRRAFRHPAAEWRRLAHACHQFNGPVREPLVLISQIQRCGGTLLSQLFDGHPEVHAHPYELKIGYPNKWTWPEIDLGKPPQHWFDILFEDVSIKLFEEGYRKGRTDDERFAFFLPPAIQRHIFLKTLSRIDVPDLRTVFDAYMTSYFNAWLNNHNRGGAKRCITAFAANLAVAHGNMERFFSVYPDGRLITLVRDPRNWYPSARRLRPAEFDDPVRAAARWNENAQAAIRNKSRFNETVCVLRFEDLISNTRGVMGYLAAWLGIAWHESLLTPSFNGTPIRANTSFQETESGVLQQTLRRYRELSPKTLEIIVGGTRETYQRIQEIVADVPA